MTVKEAIQNLEDLTIDPENSLSATNIHALYFTMAILNSLPDNQVVLIDNLLSLERTAPRP